MTTDIYTGGGIYVTADEGNMLFYNNHYFTNAWLASLSDASSVVEIPKTSCPDFSAMRREPYPKQVRLLVGSQTPTANLGSKDDIYMVIDTSVGITYSLSHCTSEYSMPTVNLGDMLITKIIPTIDYTLGTITVTMGGTDITSSSVFTDRIIIPKVSGPIEISCIATSETVTDAVGVIDTNTNNITLDSSLSSGTYTLWYEDASDTKLSGWSQVAEITK